MYYGKYPAVVRDVSKQPEGREIRVEIPGVTKGGDVLPLAEIEYPIGDKAAASNEHPTEIEILEGDLVWVEFEAGDERYPIITGYRNPRVGNSTGWRRWHHANIELNADTDIYLKAGVRVHIVAPTVFVECDTADVDCKNATLDAQESVAVTAGTTATVTASGSITLDAPTTTVKHALIVQGLLTYQAGMSGSGTAPGGGAANIDGAVNVTGEVKAGNVGLTSHHHTEHDGPSTGTGIG